MIKKDVINKINSYKEDADMYGLAIFLTEEVVPEVSAIFGALDIEMFSAVLGVIADEYCMAQGIPTSRSTQIWKDLVKVSEMVHEFMGDNESPDVPENFTRTKKGE